jgi:hypothetical protein
MRLQQRLLQAFATRERDLPVLPSCRRVWRTYVWFAEPTILQVHGVGAFAIT